MQTLKVNFDWKCDKVFLRVEMFDSSEASSRFLSTLTSLTSKFRSLFVNTNPRPTIIIPITPELRLAGLHRSTWLSLIVFFVDRTSAVFDVLTYALGIFTAHAFFSNLFSPWKQNVHSYISSTEMFQQQHIFYNKKVASATTNTRSSTKHSYQKWVQENSVRLGTIVSYISGETGQSYSARFGKAIV